MSEYRATFEVELLPTETVVEGTDRMNLTKTWSGDLEGTSHGTLVSAGDPAHGTAGYVAIERFTGTIAGRRGTVVFQQFATMDGGDAALYYEATPGSGTDELTGFRGSLELTVEDGVHSIVLRTGD
ncbi:DUF3224 domain-containing protein [Tessaracoccus oleiagri]|uniref:DUF3224 domain-containing protein n=1 Tax=Tessaracoccus oleiagri TaxID=686624 RepID=A0A1G9HPN2_9ACTN|nr:DUF3224 domain-containing protein [Tessaracoccus oleiagri]SDL14890.1 Protein of unknown function [Tessaracoccus oleiagri]